LLAGGGVPDDPDLDDGHFVEPTVFDDVSPEMTIGCEEIFGPVLGIISVESTEEAIDVANDSPYVSRGGPLDREHRGDAVVGRAPRPRSRRRQHLPLSMPQSPWGGNKESGLGREGGLEGVDAFTTVDSVVVEFDEMEDPY